MCGASDAMNELGREQLGTIALGGIGGGCSSRAPVGNTGWWRRLNERDLMNGYRGGD